MTGDGITRREAVAAGAALGAAAVVGQPVAAAASTAWSQRVDFSALGDGDGWPGWTCPGVANLLRRGGRGVLEAGSDVFPYDPRPVAFAVDRRFGDGAIDTVVEAGGAGIGLVLRRTGPRDYYAAILDDEQGALLIVRRAPEGATELGRIPLPRPRPPFRFSFRAEGASPTKLTASIAPEVGLPITLDASDAHPALQRPGDPGVLATARTLWPSQGPPAFPALGNLHLLPYGVQEGEEFMQTAVGQEVLDTIRERSTAVLREITLSATSAPGTTVPSAIAATSAIPLRDGATVRVAADVPARVDIEFAANPRFRRSRTVRGLRTNSFDGVVAGLHDLKPGRRVYWRARLQRAGRSAVGPTRSFRTLPAPGSQADARVAIASCAAQFGPIFDHLAAQQPDIFVWQGDLNYPDTAGPLAQSVSCYAGIWRDFLANPKMAPILERSLFAAQRDDHDYGVQDANSTNIVPWGIAPWDGLMGDRLYYRFATGPAEFWVLDQRHFKSDPKAPDNAAKTLLGPQQRDWLLKTLAASRAPFKVICSPCTIAPVSGNARDGSWASGFHAERDIVLEHVREHVSGRTIFVTGDTHWTMVYDHEGLFEARPCPLGIPTPNDITLTDPQVAEDARKKPGVVYADDDHGHFAVVDVGGSGGHRHLDLTLIRDDGAAAFKRRFVA